jgi:hypothetical protein
LGRWKNALFQWQEVVGGESNVCAIKQRAAVAQLTTVVLFLYGCVCNAINTKQAYFNIATEFSGLSDLIAPANIPLTIYL